MEIRLFERSRRKQSKIKMFYSLAESLYFPRFDLLLDTLTQSLPRSPKKSVAKINGGKKTK